MPFLLFQQQDVCAYLYAGVTANLTVSNKVFHLKPSLAQDQLQLQDCIMYLWE